MERIPKTRERVAGLDSIRFICALWVFFGHGAQAAFPSPFAEGSRADFILRGLRGNLFAGEAAVIVFFVISGFCIHYPFAGSDRRPRLKEFYARRFVRLLIPVMVAIPLSALLGVYLSSFHESILWSLLAELIYYLCYPLLRAVQLRAGSWRQLIIGSFIVALGVVATNPSAGNYPSYGPALNWLVGLPCWLLGCLLAESIRRGLVPNVSTITIGVWRTAILSAVTVCSLLRFHSPIGYPWTLNFFAIGVAFWLQREIWLRHRTKALAGLEWAGSWSYSLYLLHGARAFCFSPCFPSMQGSVFAWISMVLFVFAVCYSFHLLVERPSHTIARRTAENFRPAKGAALAPP
jgi:peptidoglycan/LPS O-acetylase OafA/YrhL